MTHSTSSTVVQPCCECFTTNHDGLLELNTPLILVNDSVVDVAGGAANDPVSPLPHCTQSPANGDSHDCPRVVDDSCSDVINRVHADNDVPGHCGQTSVGNDQQASDYGSGSKNVAESGLNADANATGKVAGTCNINDRGIGEEKVADSCFNGSVNGEVAESCFNSSVNGIDNVAESCFNGSVNGEVAESCLKIASESCSGVNRFNNANNHSHLHKEYRKYSQLHNMVNLI